MVWPCTCAWQGHARARGNATRMRVATNRAGILLAIMRPGQLKKIGISKEQDFLSPSGSSVFDFGVPFSWGIVQSPLPCPVPFVYATIVFK